MNEDETIKAMAKDRGMRVDKFRQLVKVKHGLAPPAEDNSRPNKRVMAINPLNPEQARKAADTPREQLPDESLTEDEIASIASLSRQDVVIDLALDQIEQLGGFVELEVIADLSSNVKSAQQAIASVARELELTQGERLSYSEMMLMRHE